MAERAAIIVVDDESDVLAAMLDALTRRFGADYRVVPYLSPCSALAGVRKSKEENEEIALVIADQRMPEMTGGNSSAASVQSCRRPNAHCWLNGAIAKYRPRYFKPALSENWIITSTSRGHPRKFIYTRILGSSWRNGRGFTAQEWS
jgi:response regulator RpfG family c-di-GMP phosphodiesterase